tara:strand:+ start:86026 stop:86532 length:507 start_codon:yes stop_codon:yes gene_type:complete
MMKTFEEFKFNNKSFDKVVGTDPKVLILGTMPGKLSLQKNQYYSHSRNSFWKLIYTLHNNENIDIDYNDRTNFLKQNHIAIWDVCDQADRESSLDADIKGVVPNDIEGFLKQYPTIEKIGFNGKKAEALYKRHFTKSNNIEYLTLLSTSPANASYNFETKLKNWSQIL